MTHFEEFDYCLDGLDILRYLDPYATITFDRGQVKVKGDLPPGKLDPEFEWPVMRKFGWTYVSETWIWQSKLSLSTTKLEPVSEQGQT